MRIKICSTANQVDEFSQRGILRKSSAPRFPHRKCLYQNVLSFVCHFYAIQLDSLKHLYPQMPIKFVSFACTNVCKSCIIVTCYDIRCGTLPCAAIRIPVVLLVKLKLEFVVLMERLYYEWQRPTPNVITWYSGIRLSFNFPYIQCKTRCRFYSINWYYFVIVTNMYIA